MRLEINCPECGDDIAIESRKLSLFIYPMAQKEPEVRYICPNTNKRIRAGVTQKLFDIIMNSDAKIVYVINFKCKSCKAEIELPASNITIYIDHNEEVISGIYRCPEEKAQLMRKISFTELNHVYKYGVKIKHKNTKEGPPISYDDILDLHELLNEDDWIKKIINKPD